MVIKKIIIGVMGGSKFISPEDEEYAYQVGALIAREGWVLLNGGRSSGVMEASAKGAIENGGLTIGILPTIDVRWASEYIDIPIVTGMGFARNLVNVLTSTLIVALPGRAGTISEIALALNYDKEVILFRFDAGSWTKPYQEDGKVSYVSDLKSLGNILREKVRKIKLT